MFKGMIYINNKEKINRIKNIKDFFIVTDFDRTLTTKQSEPSMGIIPKFLGGKCLEERLKIFNHYRPIELDYTLEEELKQKYMRDWAKESFNLLSKYVTEEVVAKSLINANLHLRIGVKEFLKKLNEKNIPVIIMSSGIGNIVEGFLKKENCLYNNTVIVSNFFEFCENKVKIDLNNIMSTSNKEYIRTPKNVRDKIENKNAGLLFGDLVEDLKMVNKEILNKTLTFGFLDDNVEDNLEKFNNNFDIVLTENADFNIVKDILRR